MECELSELLFTQLEGTASSVKQNISPIYEMMGPFPSSPKPKQCFLLKNTDIRDLFGDENFHF